MAAATSRKPRLFFSAGEASGDAYAAALGAQLADLFELEGIGGARLFGLGVERIADSSRWGAVGILEALKVAPRVWFGFQRAKKRLAQGEPGVFVPIDYGFMNVKLARHAKRHGWKVLYFIPPGSWRRNKQGADLAEVTDEIVTPFPWSKELLDKMGARAHYFGHPILEMRQRQQAVHQERSDEVAILPGSRTHEIQHNLKPILGAMHRLGLKRAVVAVASSVRQEELERLWSQIAPKEITVRWTSNPYDALHAARAAVVCSGTATLEAALCGCPMVVVYRGSKAMEIEFLIRRPKFDFISLPNLILNRGVLPELIQHDASEERIAFGLGAIWGETESRVNQLSAFEELHAALMPDHAITQTVELLRAMAATASTP